jgi:hypothetical protein
MLFFCDLKSHRVEKHCTICTSSIKVIEVTWSDEDTGAVPADLSVFPPWAMTYESSRRLQENCHAVAEHHVVHFSLESFMPARDRLLVAVRCMLWDQSARINITGRSVVLKAACLRSFFAIREILCLSFSYTPSDGNTIQPICSVCWKEVVRLIKSPIFIEYEVIVFWRVTRYNIKLPPFRRNAPTPSSRW